MDMHKFTLSLALHFLILVAQKSATYCAKAEDVSNISKIKCGECPCVSQCSPQLPTMPPPPPPLLYLAPPPPRFVYVTGLNPPPPPRFVYVTELNPPPPPGNLMYGSNPYDWQIYSRAPHLSHRIEVCLLMVVLLFVFQLLEL